MKVDKVTTMNAGSPAPPPIKPLGEFIQIDQKLVQKHLDKVVRQVSEFLNSQPSIKMEQSLLSETLVKLMADILECSVAELRENPKFREHSSWDSLAHLFTIAMIDEEFDVVLRERDFEAINTLSELAEYVEKAKAS